jgi:hypothetical protein
MSHDSKTGHDLFKLAQSAAAELASKPSIAEAAAGMPSMHARLLAEEELRHKRPDAHLFAPLSTWESRPPRLPAPTAVNITVKCVFTLAHMAAVVRTVQEMDPQLLADDEHLCLALCKAVEDVTDEDILEHLRTVT